MYSDTSNVITAQLDLARVDPCPNAEPEHVEGISQGKGPADSATWTIESCQDPVARQLDQATTVLLDDHPRRFVVTL